jgi:hypothetical protein
MVRIMSGGYKVTSASWANTFPKAKHEVRANPSSERLALVMKRYDRIKRLDVAAV